ncbi:MAG: DUF1707 domain-containing protein [Actinomycetota bacterium]|nr:DUF1707 domain-containing protein [Actinomycetota bacterium]
MGDELFLRASDNDRNKVTTFLSDAMTHGFITTEEMSSRLEQAVSAKTFSDLMPLVRDIPGGVELVRASARSYIRNQYSGNSSFVPTQTNSVNQRRNYPRHRPSRSVLIWVAAVLFFLPALQAGAFGAFFLIRTVAMLAITAGIPFLAIRFIVRRGRRRFF